MFTVFCRLLFLKYGMIVGLHVEALNPQGNRDASCKNKIYQTKLQINTDDCLSAVPPGFLLTSPLLSASFDLRRKKKKNYSCVSTDFMGNIANRPAELVKHCQSAGLPSDWPPVPRPLIHTEESLHLT